MANIKSLLYGFSRNKQSDMATAITGATNLLAFTPNSREVIAVPTLETQDNSDELGTGIYPDKLYKTRSSLQQSLQFRNSSQLLAWLFAFGCSAGTKSAHGSGWQYVFSPVQSRTMNYFTLVSQILAGTSEEVLDMIHRAVMIESVQLSLVSGTDQNTFTSTVNFLGSGRYTRNAATGTAGSTMPAPLSINQLNIGNIHNLSFISQDYDSTCALRSLEFTLTNNIKTDSNYRPCGNNSQDGYFVMSATEAGSPTIALSAVVDARPGTPELGLLLAGTEGSVDIDMRGDLIGAGPETHGIRIQMPRVRVSALTMGEDDETVTLSLNYSLLRPPSGEALVITVNTDIDGIMGL